MVLMPVQQLDLLVYLWCWASSALLLMTAGIRVVSSKWRIKFQQEKILFQKPRL
jgi:hypothetical protein